MSNIMASTIHALNQKTQRRRSTKFERKSSIVQNTFLPKRDIIPLLIARVIGSYLVQTRNG